MYIYIYIYLYMCVFVFVWIYIICLCIYYIENKWTFIYTYVWIVPKFYNSDTSATFIGSGDSEEWEDLMTIGTTSNSTSHSHGNTTTAVAVVKNSTDHTKELYVLLRRYQV